MRRNDVIVFQPELAASLMKNLVRRIGMMVAVPVSRIASLGYPRSDHK